MHGHRFEFGCRYCASELSSKPTGRDWNAFPLPGTPRRWSRDRRFDVRHIRLDVEIDPSKRTISGEVTHTLRPFVSDLDEAEFDCVELDVSRVEVAGKRAGFDVEDRKLRVALPKGLAAGKDVKVAIRYSGSPRRGFTIPYGPSAWKLLAYCPVFHPKNSLRVTGILSSSLFGNTRICNGPMVTWRAHISTWAFFTNTRNGPTRRNRSIEKHWR